MNIPSSPVQSLEIVGSLEEERYLVRVDGVNVPLTAKSFLYLTRLAHFRTQREGGWVWKEEIEPGFNQARYLYRMKNEISEVTLVSWNGVENQRPGYYRLNAEPRGIKFNVENLMVHPDYMINSLFLKSRERVPEAHKNL